MATTVNLSQERFAELARAAEEQGTTPDELVDEAVAALLRKRRFDELLSWGERHTRELGIKEEDVDRIIHEARDERRSRSR